MNLLIEYEKIRLLKCKIGDLMSEFKIAQSLENLNEKNKESSRILNEVRALKEQLAKLKKVSIV